jgi:hypothetical protein
MLKYRTCISRDPLHMRNLLKQLTCMYTGTYLQIILRFNARDYNTTIITMAGEPAFPKIPLMQV